MAVWGHIFHVSARQNKSYISAYDLDSKLFGESGLLEIAARAISSLISSSGSGSLVYLHPGGRGAAGPGGGGGAHSHTRTTHSHMVRAAQASPDSVTL